MFVKRIKKSETTKHKISESVKANWIIRKQKYGNKEGCRNPEEKNKKISIANKGKLVVPLGTPAWNKGTKGLMPIPWNKGLRGVQVAWNKGMKGQIPWNKGMKNLYKTKPASEERKRKTSEAHLKFHKENPGKGGWSGKHLPEDMKLKLRRVSAVRLAKQLHKDTKPELAFAKILDSLNIKYEQQIPIDTSIPDFFIQPNICIFVDGKYWHNRPEIKERDTRVNQALSNLGYKVLRFWDYEIFNHPENDWEIYFFKPA